MSTHFDTAEVVTVEADLGGTTLTFVNVYIALASSCLRNYALDFDALLVDRGDQIVFGYFSAHHPSCYSRTGDDRSALDGAINSSQLDVENQDLTTRHPSQGQLSSPDITLLSGHLLLDVTWSTLTILVSHHLPITVSLFILAPPTPRKIVPTRTSTRLTGRDSK